MIKANAVYVGRFQPFHREHLRICRESLAKYQWLVIIVGSYRSPRTIKNPFSYEERVEMIKSCLSEEELCRVRFVPLRDFVYSDSAWISAMQEAVSSNINNESVFLIGCKKDNSSWYLDSFPQWSRDFTDLRLDISATDIREKMFEYSELSDCVPEGVSQFLSKINWFESDLFWKLKYEQEFVRDYRDKWKSAPYPPTFVTTDSVVIKSGHVLVVKRKFNPGSGKFALPGGYLAQDETVFECAIRELKEETGIRVPKHVLAFAFKTSKVFDSPDRDSRGRTITHAHMFKLEDAGELPRVSGSDDAASAQWMSFADVFMNEENFYSDHVHIIQDFLMKM